MQSVIYTTMNKRSKPQPYIEKKLLGRIEFKDGQYVFVPHKLFQPKKKILWLPYVN